MYVEMGFQLNLYRQAAAVVARLAWAEVMASVPWFIVYRDSPALRRSLESNCLVWINGNA